VLDGIGGMVSGAARADGIAVVSGLFDAAPRDLLRKIGDRIKQMEPMSVSLLAGVEGESVTLIGMASDEAVRRGVHAGNLVREISSAIGGSGGGKPAMGQGGGKRGKDGKNSAALEDALAKAEGIVRAQIASAGGK
jgi:alanyl-tRNA synthetase